MRPGRMGIRCARKRGFRTSRTFLASLRSRWSTARMKRKRSLRFFTIRWKIAVARNGCAISGRDLGMTWPGSLMVAPTRMKRQSRRGWNENEVTSSERFAGKKDGTLWYYRMLVTAFRQHGDHADLIDELNRATSEVAKFVRER